MRKLGFSGALAAAALASLTATTAPAQDSAGGFLATGYDSCDQFFMRLAETEFTDEPALFLCHDFQYKPLFLYGFIRDLGQGRFTMMLVKNRTEPCSGEGDLVWSGSGLDRVGSASGRFLCKDGAQGGLAFELQTVRDGGQDFVIGSMFGGVDGNGSNGADEVISADFYVFSKTAVQMVIKNR